MLNPLLSTVASDYKIHSQSPEGEALLNYHRLVKVNLNTEFFNSVADQKFQRKKSLLSQVGDVASAAVGMLPFVGKAAENAVKLGFVAADGVAEANKTRQYNNIRNFLPGCDSVEFAKFSKMVATEILNRKSDQVKSLPLDVLKKSAEEDSAKVLDLIRSGEALEFPEYKDLIRQKEESDLSSIPSLFSDTNNSNPELVLKNLSTLLVDKVGFERTPQRDEIDAIQEARRQEQERIRQKQEVKGQELRQQQKEMPRHHSKDDSFASIVEANRKGRIATTYSR